MKSRGILGRYATLLELVAASSKGMSLSEIVWVTGLPSSTVHRLISALVDVGYLINSNGQKNYKLGPRIIRLFYLKSSRTTVALLAQPSLQNLVNEFSETAFLARLRGQAVEVETLLTPEHRSGAIILPGRDLQIHAAAAAKAIFAFQSRELVDQVLELPRTEFTDRTVTNRKKILNTLANVREEEFAESVEEMNDGVWGFSCPVKFSSSDVIYSVGIVGLSQRMAQYPKENIQRALAAAAREIAAQLERELDLIGSDNLPSIS